jgi:hypothetical protein
MATSSRRRCQAGRRKRRREEAVMKAEIGDEVTVKGRYPGSERHGEVIDVLGDDGSPPYLISWIDGYESLFYPSDNTIVHHHARHPMSA